MNENKTDKSEGDRDLNMSKSFTLYETYFVFQSIKKLLESWDHNTAGGNAQCLHFRAPFSLE